MYKRQECDIVDGLNPSQAFKAIKNDVEIKNTKNAHIKDGVAVSYTHLKFDWPYDLQNKSYNQMD